MVEGLLTSSVENNDCFLSISFIAVHLFSALSIEDKHEEHYFYNPYPSKGRLALPPLVLIHYSR